VLGGAPTLLCVDCRAMAVVEDVRSDSCGPELEADVELDS